MREPPTTKAREEREEVHLPRVTPQEPRGHPQLVEEGPPERGVPLAQTLEGPVEAMVEDRPLPRRGRVPTRTPMTTMARYLPLTMPTANPAYLGSLSYCSLTL